MGMLEELNTLLERIPVWRQLVAMPERVAALEARLAAIEAQLAGSTGMLCPMCNAPHFKRVATDTANPLRAIGFTTDVFQCGSCGHREERHRDALPQ
jgi:hypothetical protein